MKRRGVLFGFFLCAESRVLAGWTTALAAYNVLNVWLFTVYGGETSIAQVYEKLPRIWKNAFGQYFISVNSIQGWLATQFFSFLPVLAGAYLAILATSLFAADEESRAVVFLLTQPVRRSAVWAAKAAAGMGCLLILLGVNLCASLAACALFTPAAAPVRTVLLSYVMSAVFLTFLASLFAVVAATLRTQKAALATGLGLLVLLFLLNMILASLEVPLWVRRINPFHYHDCSRLVAEQALPAGGMLYWGVGAVALALTAMARFIRKERS